MRFLLLTLTAASLLFACGDAGVQTRIQDDFTYNFNFQQGGRTYNANTQTKVRKDILKYGSVINQLDISSIDITVSGYSGTANGSFNVSFTGTTGSITLLANQVLTNGTTTLPKSSFNAIANALRNSDGTLAITSNFTSNANSDFTITVAMKVDATLKLD